jgi:single-stranded-DNA-specific exonuclease
VFVQFQDAFRQVAALALSAEQLKPCLHLDAEVTLAELDADFLAWHEALQPFGLGNPQPTFLVRGVVPVEPPRILKEKHLRLLLRQPSSAPTAGGVRPVMSAIYFQSAHLALPPPPWDVALQVEANEYRGQVNLQAQVEAIRAAAT